MRTGALGDVCLTFPVLRALCATGRRVDVMAKRAFGPLLVRAGRIDRLWDAEAAESMWLFLARNPAGYETAVVFSEAHRLAASEAGIPEVLSVAARPAPGVSASAHFCSVWPRVERVGLADSAGRRAGPARALDKQHCPKRPPSRERGSPSARIGSVVIAPGSAGAEKRWPLDRWRAVDEALRERGVQPRWIGGPLEPWAAERPDLAGLIAIASEAAVWLGADSGPAHLAGLCGARVGIVARPESLAWLPVGAKAFAWEAGPADIAGWALGDG